MAQKNVPQSESRIRIAVTERDPVVRFAAEELARYLKKIDPALRVDMLFGFSGKGVKTVRVGRSPEGMIACPKVEDEAWDDAIAIDVTDGEGFITGSNPRSVLIAVYRFLREAGCRFLRPGPEGERIPQKSLEGLRVTVTEKAAHRHRGVCIEGAVSWEHAANMIDFLPKAGMNCYFVQFFSPATFFERWYGHADNPYLSHENVTRDMSDAMTAALEGEIKKRGLMYHKVGHGWTCEPFGIEGTGWHPEKQYTVTEETRACLAMLDGRRELFRNTPLNTNLCYSNPRVRQKITDAITAYCRDNPQVDVLHFWLADAKNNQCECAECAKRRPADWYVLMLNELDEKMTREGIATKVVFLVYVDLLWAPEKELLRNPDRFILMFAPITRSYASHYGECLQYAQTLAPYERNRLKMPTSLAENLARLREWQKGFSGDSFVFDYHLMWAHVSDPGYEKCARNLFEDMRDLKSVGLDGMVSCQTQRCFFPTDLPLWMMAAALWDSECDYEAAARDYYLSAYGPEGEKVRDCLKRISGAVSLYDLPALSDEVPEKVRRADDEALRRAIDDLEALCACHGEEGDTRAEWRNLACYTGYMHRVREMLEALEAEDAQKADAALDRLADFLRRRELALEASFDVPNAIKSWKRKMIRRG